MNFKIITLILIMIFLSFGCVRNIRDDVSSHELVEQVLRDILKNNYQGVIHITGQRKIVLNFKWVGTKRTFMVYHPITARTYAIDLNSDNTAILEDVSFDISVFKKIIDLHISDLRHYKADKYEYFSYIEEDEELFRISMWKGRIDEINIFSENIYSLKISYKRRKVERIELKDIFTLILENK